MATTTAVLTLTSDMTSDSLSAAPTFNLTSNGTDGLTKTTGLAVDSYATGSATIMYDKDDYTDGYLYIYIKNTDSTFTNYLQILIDAEEIGRLPGGAWCFLPWHGDSEFKVQPQNANSLIEHALYY